MRTIISLLTICLVSASARADHRTVAPPRDLPPACRSLARVPDDAASLVPALQAAISTASCEATIRMRAIQLRSPTVGAELDSAMLPSLALLDAVIKEGDVPWQLMALHAKANIYLGAAERLRSASPRDHRHDAQIATWLEKADAAHRNVVALSEAIRQQVNTTGVLAYMVSDSDQERDNIALAAQRVPPVASR